MLSVPPEFEVDTNDINSGAHALIGYDVDLTAQDGTASVVLRVEPRHLNRNGTLHGGIIAMMLDAAAGFAASRGDTVVGFAPVVTLSLNTSFVAAAREGMVVTSKGRISGGGASIVYAGADLYDTDGVLLALGSGVFKRIRKRAT